MLRILAKPKIKIVYSVKTDIYISTMRAKLLQPGVWA